MSGNNGDFWGMVERAGWLCVYVVLAVVVLGLVFLP